MRKHQYMMLARLQQDCEYYLGYGNRHPKHLWADNETKHIEEMRKIYNILPENEKPEWLSMEDIEKYAEEMGVKS